MRWFMDTATRASWSVPSNDLASPRKHVVDALPSRLTSYPKLQVLRPVVGAVSVDVVHLFAREETTTDFFLHTEAVFKHPTVTAYQASSDLDVPALGHMSARHGPDSACVSSLSTSNNNGRVSVPLESMVVGVAVPERRSRTFAPVDRTTRLRRVVLSFVVATSLTQKRRAYLGRPSTPRCFAGFRYWRTSRLRHVLHVSAKVVHSALVS